MSARENRRRRYRRSVKNELPDQAKSDRLEAVIVKVIEDHPGEVSRYHEGKASLLGFFVGQVMRSPEGKSNPGLVVKEIHKHLARVRMRQIVKAWP